MKKIILLFFTFSGICSCFSQKTPDTGNTVQSTLANIQPLKSSFAKEKSSFRFYPNPAKNKVEIEIAGFAAGYVKVQLMSNTGKLLREEKRLVLSGNEVIVFMFSEKPGLYFLFVKQGKITLKSKLVVN